MGPGSWALIRWGAPAAFVGGILFVVSAVLTNFFVVSGVARYLADVPAYAALLLGLGGLYVAQSDRFGLVGEAGYSIAFAGYAVAVLCSLLIAVAVWTAGPENVPRWLGATANLAVLAVIFGSVLFGVATLQAKILPRGGALLLIFGPLLLVVMLLVGVRDVRLFTLPSALFGAGWAWLGYDLPVAFRRKRRDGERPV